MFKEEDMAIRRKIDAKNGLENYVYNMQNTANGASETGKRLGQEDKDTIKQLVVEA